MALIVFPMDIDLLVLWWKPLRCGGV
jgi:hypothetical protein